MPSATFWIGYSVLTLLTAAATAMGRNVFLVSLFNAVLALLLWGADANGYKVPSESDLMVLGWGIFLLPQALMAAVLSAVIGRSIYSHRLRVQEQELEHTRIHKSSVTAEQHGSLQLQGLIGVGIAIVLTLSATIPIVRDQYYIPYLFANHLLGGVTFGWGSMLYARSEGHTHWWALLGVLWAVPGGRLLAIILFTVLAHLAGQPVSSATRSATS